MAVNQSQPVLTRQDVVSLLKVRQVATRQTPMLNVIQMSGIVAELQCGFTLLNDTLADNSVVQL